MRKRESVDVDLNIALYSEADACFRAGRFRDALRLFKRAAQADPLDSDCWFAIGSCLDALNRPTRAEAAYLKALSMAPEEDHPALPFSVGNALFDQQRFEEATGWYARVPAEHEVFARADRNRRLAESKAKRTSQVGAERSEAQRRSLTACSEVRVCDVGPRLRLGANLPVRRREVQTSLGVASTTDWAPALALACALAGRSPRCSTGPLGSGGRRSIRP